MASPFRQRVKIGYDENHYPIYKWASGKTLDELNDSIFRLYIEHGLGKHLMEEIMSYNTEETPLIAVEELKVDDGVLFEEYATQWMKRYKEKTLKETTLNGYNSYMRKHLLPAFGNMNLLEISIDDIQDFMNDREELAKKTIREIWVFLQQILDSAVEDGLIKSNPAKSKRLKNPSDIVTIRDALPLDTFLDIVAQIIDLDETERRLMALLMFTGMRRGEVLGLRWEDIDYENMMIHVKRGVTYPSNQPNITTPKTKNGVRSIPLDTSLITLLARPEHAEGFIIGGKSPITLTAYRCMYERIEKRVNLYDATAHIFRHSYLTLLDQAGVDPKTLQMIAGHGDIKTTMNRYVHSDLSQLHSAREKFGVLVSGSIGFQALVQGSEKYCELLNAA